MSREDREGVQAALLMYATAILSGIGAGAVVMKALGILKWTWVAVLAPFWVPTAFVSAAFAIATIVVALTTKD